MTRKEEEEEEEAGKAVVDIEGPWPWQWRLQQGRAEAFGCSNLRLLEESSAPVQPARRARRSCASVTTRAGNTPLRPERAPVIKQPPDHPTTTHICSHGTVVLFDIARC